MGQQLRDYQEACLNSIFINLGKGKNRILCSLATGGGKTTIIAELLCRVFDPNAHRALILAHTEEIIYQLTDRVTGQFGSRLDYWYPVNGALARGIGIVMGSGHDDMSARIVVATWQSLHETRLKYLLAHGAFDFVVYDEAHHIAPGNEAYKLLSIVKAMQPEVKIFGFTATAERTDKQSLGAVFEVMDFQWTILDGIRGGYLVPPVRINLDTDTDLDEDEEAELTDDDILKTANWIELAVKAYKEYLSERPTLAFLPKVAMSKAFVAALNADGIAAAHIDGGTPKEARRKILADYQQGKLKVVSNVAVLVEGFDSPHTSGILDARTTKSKPVKTQMYGRGLRLAPGKKDCLIVSLAKDTTGFLMEGTLKGKMNRCPACSAEYFVGLKVCPVCQFDLTTTPDDAAEAARMVGTPVLDDDKRGKGRDLKERLVALFEEAFAEWHKDADEFLSAGLDYSDGALVIAPPTYDEDKAARLRDRIRKGIDALARNAADPDTVQMINFQLDSLNRELQRVDHYTLYHVGKDKAVTFLQANGDLPSLLVAGDMAALRRNQATKGHVGKDAKWRILRATDGQLNMLRKFRVEHDPVNITRGEASALITHAMYVRHVRQFVYEDDIVPEPRRELVYADRRR